MQLVDDRAGQRDPAPRRRRSRRTGRGRRPGDGPCTPCGCQRRPRVGQRRRVVVEQEAVVGAVHRGRYVGAPPAAVGRLERDRRAVDQGARRSCARGGPHLQERHGERTYPAPPLARPTGASATIIAMPKTSAKDTKKAATPRGRGSATCCGCPPGRSTCPPSTPRPRPASTAASPTARRPCDRSGRGWPTCRSGSTPRAAPAAPAACCSSCRAWTPRARAGRCATSSARSTPRA